MSGEWIWGLHSVEACLENYPELILELLHDSEMEAGPREKLRSIAKDLGVALKEQKKLPGTLADKRTQGIVARIKSFPLEDYKDFEDDFVAGLEEGGKQYAVLDSLQDPRNYGAIVRSAAAFGISAVIVGRRDQCPPTGIVAQASAGNFFRVRNVAATNLSRVLERARDVAGDVQVLALDAKGKDLRQLASQRAGRSWVWVLGSEGSGLRPGLLSQVTEVVAIPMEPKVESLNASVAGSLAFFTGYSSK